MFRAYLHLVSSDVSNIFSGMNNLSDKESSSQLQDKL